MSCSVVLTIIIYYLMSDKFNVTEVSYPKVRSLHM